MKRFKKLLPIAVTLALVLTLLMPMAALAAALTVTDTLSDYSVSTVADHTIAFTSATEIAVGGTLTVTFPAGFNMGAVEFGDVDLKVATVDMLLAALPGTGTGTAIGCAVASQVMTFTLNDTDVIATGLAVEIEIGLNATFTVAGDAQITNPATADRYVITVATVADTGSVNVDIGDSGTTGVSGAVVPTIEITTQPPTIDLSSMAIGATPESAAGNNGLVKCNEAAFTVTGKDQNVGANTGYMLMSADPLDAKLQIYNVHTSTYADSNGSVSLVANPTTVTGTSGLGFLLRVKQGAITYNDVAGTYSITLVVTAALAI